MRTSHHLARQLLRQTARSCSTSGRQLIADRPSTASLAACTLCNAAAATASWQSSSIHQQSVRWASKKKTASKGSMKRANQKRDSDEADDEITVEDHPVPVLAKGKKAKAAQVTPEDAIEAFHLDELEKSMDNAVDRLSKELRVLVGRVERLSPSLLDSVRVEEHGQRQPLQNYATVSVQGADALTVNIYDVASVKAVERALRDTADLNLNPQRIDDMTLRIPVPRPDVQARSALAKKASELAENARVSIRAVRHQGQKDLKADQDNKIVGESDARRDAKHLQDATKKRTDEVDALFNKAKRVLLDE